ncbi:MAG: gliding motility protein GldN [Bacteroidales bacterium]|nr:gliding motility protein GldN [Bacteroidales bacterium]
MKKRHSVLLALLLMTIPTVAQNNDGPTADDIYVSTLERQRRPIPFPNLRESDVVWSTMLWKTLDLNELYNQFIYYPIENPDPSGKKSLAYTLWDAIVAGEIPIYEDDQLTIPIDNEKFVKQYTKPDTILLEIGYDDDDNELYQTIIRPREFDGAEIYQYSVREAWFVGRQDTRQDSRRLALAPLKQSYHKFANTEEEIYLGRLPLFWVPMQNPTVRRLLARYSAYPNDNNLVGQPSWDWIFIHQRYTAFITRESNIYSRAINHYLTGEDALDQADLIEDKLYDIENDLWDY